MHPCAHARVRIAHVLTRVCASMIMYAPCRARRGQAGGWHTHVYVCVHTCTRLDAHIAHTLSRRKRSG